MLREETLPAPDRRDEIRACAQEVRRRLIPLRTQSGFTAVALLLGAAALYVALFAGIALDPPIWQQALFSFALGPSIALLFRIAHDAGHGCHFRSRSLNRVTARLAIIPSYHPYSVWLLFHNVLHHGFTNLKGRDYIWVPLTKSEYDNLSSWRRLVERLYRTTPGLGIYYAYAIWWKKMMFPNRALLPQRDAKYALDSTLVCLSVLAQLAALAAFDASPAALLRKAALCVVVPFLVFTWMVGFVSFFNHTHPRVRWFERAEEWSFFGGQVNCTVYMKVPPWLIFFLTDLGLHSAHHIDPRVPIWKLEAADARINDSIPRQVVRETWCVRTHRDIIRACKLYDFKSHRWLDFGGRPTGSVPATEIAA